MTALQRTGGLAVLQTTQMVDGMAAAAGEEE
jgi:hypothetical protein